MFSGQSGAFSTLLIPHIADQKEGVIFHFLHEALKHRSVIYLDQSPQLISHRSGIQTKFWLDSQMPRYPLLFAFKSVWIHSCQRVAVALKFQSTLRTARIVAFGEKFVYLNIQKERTADCLFKYLLWCQEDIWNDGMVQCRQEKVEGYNLFI